MKTFRNILLVTFSALLLTFTVACAPEGVVTDKKVSTDYPCRKVPASGCTTYEICTESTPSGKFGCDKVKKDVYDKCNKNDRWPDCKKK